MGGVKRRVDLRNFTGVVGGQEVSRLRGGAAVCSKKVGGGKPNVQGGKKIRHPNNRREGKNGGEIAEKKKHSARPWGLRNDQCQQRGGGKKQAGGGVKKNTFSPRNWGKIVNWVPSHWETV